MTSTGTMPRRTFSLGGSSRLGLLLAAALAIAAGILVLVALNARGSDNNAPVLTGDGDGFVVVATQDIPARTENAAGMIEVRALPSNAILGGAFAEGELVEGRIARIPIYKGEQLVQGKLASERTDLGLAYIVPEGTRGMAVKVDKVIGAGGLVRPGDKVDVLAVLDIKYEDLLTERTVEITRAFVIAQNVDVLAVEQALENQISAVGSTSGASDSEGTFVEQPDAQPESTVATLALSPEEALQVLLAEEKGAIRLSVRPVGDDRVLSVDGISPLALADEEFSAALLELLATPK